MAVCERKLYTMKLGAKPWSWAAARSSWVFSMLRPILFRTGAGSPTMNGRSPKPLSLSRRARTSWTWEANRQGPVRPPCRIAVEIERVIPIIRAVRESSDIPISIDTTKSEVALQALSAGADIINDVSSLRFDPGMARVAAESGAPLILMHMLGVPRTMQINPVYESVISEIIAFLEERMRFAAQNGVERRQIIVDPGIGFGKTVAHNLYIIRNLDSFSCMDRPILLGASRKRFIGTVLGRTEGDRELGTAVANAFGIAAGAHILRVHDVAFHREAVRMAEAVRSGYFPESPTEKSLRKWRDFP